jgi:hypothetical protein
MENPKFREMVEESLLKREVKISACLWIPYCTDSQYPSRLFKDPKCIAVYTVKPQMFCMEAFMP